MSNYIKSKYLPVYLKIAFILILFLNFNSNAKPPNQKINQLNLDGKSLNFLVLSDWGRERISESDKKAKGQRKVASQLGKTAKQIEASFIVTCGDNFHGNGVRSKDDPFWKINFEDVYTSKSLQIPWYIALGNHDHVGNVQAELDYARTSNRWTQPSEYYSFEKHLPDGNSILFVIIDTSPFIQDYLKETKDNHHIKDLDTSSQLKWCDSLLSKSKAKWKFVFGHHPAYSAGGKHGSTIEMQNSFVPMFEKYHVDAVFSGHDHDLQHSKPEGSTVDYFGVGGGSGARITSQGSFSKFCISSLGFGVVSVTSKEFRISFINKTGEVLYQYDKKK